MPRRSRTKGTWRPPNCKLSKRPRPSGSSAGRPRSSSGPGTTPLGGEDRDPPGHRSSRRRRSPRTRLRAGSGAQDPALAGRPGAAPLPEAGTSARGQNPGAHRVASIPSPNSGVFELGPLAAHVRADAAARHRVPSPSPACAGRGAAAAGTSFSAWRCGVAFGIIGTRLPRDHELGRGPGRVVGGLRGLEGRTGRLGRHLPRLRGRRGDRAPLRERGGLRRCRRTGLLVAQAIGRVGNWWNQELFGKPTDAAWGLEIDLEHRPPEYADSETFTRRSSTRGWDLFAAGALLLDRFFRIRPRRCSRSTWRSTARSGYEETLRIDSSHHFAGQRLNFWVALVLLVLSAAFFLWWQIIGPWRRRRRAGKGVNQVVAGGDGDPEEARPILSLASEA